MIHRYLLLFSITLFTFSSVTAQKEDYVWFLGYDLDPEPGVQGMIWDWTTEGALPVKHNLAYGVGASNMSICDKGGNLLFWTNGCAVINRDQAVMPHGDTLNWDPFRERFGWDDCNDGYPSIQNIKIINDPGKDDGYYLFHKAVRYNGQFEDITRDLRISYVDMSLDSGMGDVVFYDSILTSQRLVPACLEVMQDAESDGWWILQPIEDDSIILTYTVDQNGVTRLLDQESGVYFEDLRAGAGTMRFSPDGTRIAYYDYFLNLHVYDFDRITGQISNHQKVIIFDDAEGKPDNQFRFGLYEVMVYCKLISHEGLAKGTDIGPLPC